MAAGMTIRESAFDRFERLFQDELTRQRGDSEWQNTILSDGEITDFDLDAAEQIRCGGPWGQEFEQPVFDGVFEVVDYRLLQDKHLKLRLRSRASDQLANAIYFGYSSFHDRLPQQEDYRVAFQLTVNEYNGRKSPQLNVVFMAENPPVV